MYYQILWGLVKMNGSFQCRRGLSTVISSLIMCSVVIAIGASVWSVTQSVSSITGHSYFESVTESVDKIKERFCIENILTGSNNMLQVWIFNYGEVDITIQQLLITGSGNISSHPVDVSIARGNIAKIDVVPADVALMNGLSISIEVVSNRGNEVHDSIIIY